MKRKPVKLEWYVLRYDTNCNKVINYNILQSSTLQEELYKQVTRKKITNYKELREHLRIYFMHHFWSKSECEMLIGPIHTLGTLDYFKKIKKIDMYNQIEPNLDRIVEYIIQVLNIKFSSKEKGGEKNE